MLKDSEVQVKHKSQLLVYSEQSVERFCTFEETIPGGKLVQVEFEYKFCRVNNWEELKRKWRKP